MIWEHFSFEELVFIFGTCFFAAVQVNVHKLLIARLTVSQADLAIKSR